MHKQSNSARPQLRTYCHSHTRVEEDPQEEAVEEEKSSKTWKTKEELAKEAETQQVQEPEPEPAAPATGGAYRPGALGGGLRTKKQNVDLTTDGAKEEFPTLAEAVEREKSGGKKEGKKEDAPSPKPKPAGNVWTARNANTGTGKAFTAAGSSWAHSEGRMDFTKDPSRP
eukprot:TRINITY_DN49044_c0_g1_i2.p2 TRINITY_DN49044_c0_g1~~TRINITY_DN49044_c0_g1_i2.p2  ORF type:complete len:170 (-),score=25.15 TRINITY_DN49044_c0_g1_i2:206-715(-)